MERVLTSFLLISTIFNISRGLPEDQIRGDPDDTFISNWEENVTVALQPFSWQCPKIEESNNLECGCDIPHTLRCNGNLHGLELLALVLRKSPYSVSLLDCTLQNVTFLSDANIFEGISLHGLVISSGEIKRVHRLAFSGMINGLQALGLPNNKLTNVPSSSILPLANTLDRLDLSNNLIQTITSSDFTTLKELTYLELSDNKITSISPRSFVNLRKLQFLKLKGNRLGDFLPSLQALLNCKNLIDLDLKSNSLRGALGKQLIPKLPLLQTLNLDKNLLTSIQNNGFEKFPNLVSLSIRHNQIDVLQDHAFNGLAKLKLLDLGHNGIVAMSEASLQHLPKLITLDLTHNFLRALTLDLVAPLPEMAELNLDGNDITLLEQSAVEKLTPNQSLSLHDNPLNCDCKLKPFANWLRSIPNEDKIKVGAVCSTPQLLEGAPVMDLTIESLACDDDDDSPSEYVKNTLDKIPIRNLSHIRDVSEKITFSKVEMQGDYSLYLNWIIPQLSNYYCDTLFIYREAATSEILIDQVPIQCSETDSQQQTIIVHLDDSTALIEGSNYRFCLVLLEKKDQSSEMVVGCSNFTRLQTAMPGEETIFICIPLVLLLAVIIVLVLYKYNIREYCQNSSSIVPISSNPEELSVKYKEYSNSRYYKLHKLQATTSL